MLLIESHATISSFAGDLLSFAETALEHERSRWSSFPLWLKATAGLRIISLEDREALMAKVKSYLAEHSKFTFAPSHARVISGEEEGVFGWITVNYLNDRLATGATDTLGAIDMGGASLQITFQAGVQILSNFFNLELTQARGFDLYTHSFLYYGNDQARIAVKNLVVDDWCAAHSASCANHSALVEYPCWVEGTPSNTFDSTNYGAINLTAPATMDFPLCQQYIKKLMLKTSPCLTDPRTGPQPATSSCSIAGVYQPPLLAPSTASQPAALEVGQVSSSGTPGFVRGHSNRMPEPDSATLQHSSGPAAAAEFPMAKFYAFSTFSHLYSFLGITEAITMNSLLVRTPTEARSTNAASLRGQISH